MRCDSLPRNDDRATLPPLLKQAFKRFPKFWETRDQTQPGSVLDDHGDPGNEAEGRTWLSVWKS